MYRLLNWKLGLLIQPKFNISEVLPMICLLNVSLDLVLSHYLFLRHLTHSLTEGRQLILSKRKRFKSFARLTK